MKRNHTILIAFFLLTSIILTAEPPVDVGQLAENTMRLCQSKQQFADNWQDYVSRDLRNMNDYDVQYYRINMTLDFDNESITADNIIEVEIVEDNVNIIELDFDDELEVTGLTVNGAAATFAQESRLLIINPALPLNAGEIVTISVQYEGEPSIDGVAGGGLYFHAHDGEPIAFTFVQPRGAPQWYPCKDYPYDKADTVDIWMTIPDDYELAANGMIVDTIDHGDGTKTVKYHESTPISTYLISIACTNYDIETLTYSHDGTDMPIHNYIFPEDHDIQAAAFEDTGAMIDFLSGIYGTYPFLDEKYGHAVVPGFGGAMEHQTCTTFGSLISTPDNYSTVLHELSHQWAGDMITCDTWAYIWLNEGFATYSEALYTEYISGFDWYLYHMTQFDNGLEDKLERDPDGSQNHVLDWVVYGKGAWVLHMLRYMLGDETFFEGVANYMSDENLRYGTATNEDLEANMEEAAGIELDWYFDQWYYQTGRPSYDYCYYTSDVVDSIKVTMLSYNNSDEPFDLYVPYHLNTNEGRIWAPGGLSNHTMALEGELDSLVWDPINRILDGGFEEMIPVLEEPVRSRDGSVMLVLPDFFDSTFAGYYILRSTNGSDWNLITGEPIPVGVYHDNSVDLNQTYHYAIMAVSGEDSRYMGPASNVVELQAIDYSFDQGVLAIDMTDDYPESSPMPTDEEVDVFYRNILSEYAVTWWDVATDGLVPLSEMARYSSVVIYCDDINSAPFDGNLYSPYAYLSAGGNLLVSSWRHLEDLSSNDYRAAFHIDEAWFHNTADFSGALASGGYPQLEIDPDKVELATWNGVLPYVCALTPTGDAEVLYRYDSSTDDPEWENQICGIRYDDGNKFYLLGFPLYFVEDEQAEDFMAMVMDDFGEPQASGSETVPPVRFTLNNYPNPFNPSTTIRFDLPEAGEVELAVYNVRGQRVATLAKGMYDQGEHAIEWDGLDHRGTGVSSGVYLCRLTVGAQNKMLKMILMK